ncbi:MAG: hypothetical protein RR933_01065 [Oscillospiraceae bacterium]
MNQNLEFAEKLVEKTGVSYAEAKEALENNGWDILEAIFWLESQGKVKERIYDAKERTNSEYG